MTSSKSEARERQRLQRLAAEYRTRGFDVHIAPSGKELPSFLQGFRPDMIAKKGDINVVIEVTAQESLKGQRGVQELATAVEGQRGWRFELVVTNPRPEPEVERASELVSERTITQRLASVEGLRTEGNWEAALLLTWTVFEAEMRRMLKREGKADEKRSALSGLKTLYSLGLLNRQDYDILDRSLRLRNQITHGFETGSSQRDLDEFVTVVRRFRTGMFDADEEH
jgi:REase_AHJR-like protein